MARLQLVNYRNVLISPPREELRKRLVENCIFFSRREAKLKTLSSFPCSLTIRFASIARSSDS